jgi:predicted ATPase
MDFEKVENSSDMNILIGANGSGKSNFIEIINQFCRNLIFDYTFDPSIIR